MISTTNAVHVLLADDDEDDRMLFKELVSELSISAFLMTVEDGEELMNVLSTIQSSPPPHLIFLDINMPRMNGTQTLRRLKTDDRFRNIPVIIYSTSLNNIERDECLALGAHSYVIKPVSYRDTVATAKRFYEMSMGIE